MPPLHVHDEDETFVVLEGSLTLFVGDQRDRGRARGRRPRPEGRPAHLPRRVRDGARASSSTSSPQFEDFVRAASRPAELPALPPAPDGPPTPEQAEVFTRVAAENGIIVLGPPGMLPTDL